MQIGVKMSNFYQEYDLKFGKMTIACNEDGINYVGMGCGGPEHAQRESAQLLDTAAQQLEQYFQGKRQTFDVPLSPTGTPFQQKVWGALCAIPYGETRSYKQIAEMVGNPKACRAVGMANNRNHILIIIPCHRVIGANGSLVGYGGGLELKEKLLELEKKNKG